MKKTISLLLLLFSTTISFSQSNDGYWDSVRTTTETISLRAGEKKFIKSADFPTGTTEIVYRITLIDDNQKLSSSLVSLLKSIPDPTGISQGTAGAVFLLSNLSGDDKCKYSIYTASNDVENYIKTNKTNAACFIQNTPINKEAKLITFNSSCLTQKTQNLYFAFESDNLLLKQKIIIEIVPWINKKLSRGWNSENKKDIITLTKSFKIYSKLTKKEQFSTDFLEHVTQKYTFKEYTNLLSEEKKLLNELFTDESLKKTGELSLFVDLHREAAITAYKNNNLEKAVSIIQTEIIDKKSANAIDYCSIGTYYMVSKQFEKAEKCFVKGLELDASEINLHLQMAHLYLFTNRVSQAKELHKKYKNQNISSKRSWIEQTKNDFELFKKFNLPENNFKKIIRILE